MPPTILHQRGNRLPAEGEGRSLFKKFFLKFYLLLPMIIMEGLVRLEGGDYDHIGIPD
jgi:hypothetical protein